MASSNSRSGQARKVLTGRKGCDACGAAFATLRAWPPVYSSLARKSRSVVPLTGNTPSRTPPALSPALSQHSAFSASFIVSVQAGPVSFIR